MEFIAFILIFLLFWTAMMAIMVVFAIPCIVLSALSAAKSKRFLASHQYPDYKSGKNSYIAALVFFILTCLTSAGTLLTFIAFVAMIIDGSFRGGDIFNPTTAFITVCALLLTAAVVLGIRCFVWYSRAEKLNRQLYPVIAVPFVPGFYAAPQSFRVCPICGSANDMRNNFCVRCGQYIR